MINSLFSLNGINHINLTCIFKRLGSENKEICKNIKAEKVAFNV